MKKYLLLLIIVFSVGGMKLNQTFADDLAENCFEILQENVAETGVFGEGNETLKNLNYNDLNFSRFYKTNSLLGIELDEALFEQRIYIFGEQTGLESFTPFSPFVDGKMTEKFDENLKQYTIIENYLQNPEGEKIFLNCGLIKANNEDLKNLKSENYGYDGDVNSLLKTDEKLDYKALYSVIASFDYDDNSLTYWDKFFVFPKAIGSNYFNFYDVIKNTDLGKGEVVSKFEIEDFDDFDEIGKIFPYSKLRQAIENKFSDFAKRLAFRGEIHFDVLKRLLQTKDNDYFSNIWDVVMNSKQFVKYLKAKEKGTLQQTFAGNEGMIEFYQYNEKWLDQTELRILSLLEEQNIVYDEKIDVSASLNNQNVENNFKDSDLRQNDTKQNENVGAKDFLSNEIGNQFWFYGVFLLIICGIICLLTIFLKKKKQ